MITLKNLFSSSLLLLVLTLTGCGGGGGGGGQAGNINDTISPSVTSVAPVDGASKVAFSTTVTAKFNEAVIAISAELGLTLNRTSDSSFIFGVGSYDSTTQTVTFTPNNPLSEYTQYTGMVKFVSDTSGNILTSPYNWTFTTQDLTAPVTSASEAAGLYTNVLSVTLTCSDINGSGCATTYYSLDGSTPSLVYSSALTINEGDTTLRFYSVDNEGQTEAEQSIAYTVDLTPPTVQTISPSSGDTAVSRDTSLQIIFSEPVDQSTLIAANIILDNNMSGAITYDAGTNTAIYTPTALLQCNTIYSGTISGVSDLAGNIMTTAYNWTFTTTADCDGPATTASPNGGVIKGVSVDVTLSCSDLTSGCARIIYTTDGSRPSFEPVNGTIISGNSAGPIALGVGNTLLQFFAEDNAGNKEVLRSKSFSVSNSGYLYIATERGLARGIGQKPDWFETTSGNNVNSKIFRDASNNRLYGISSGVLYVSDDEGFIWHKQCCDNAGVNDVYAEGSQIWIGTSKGLYISKDNLQSYTVVDINNGLSDKNVTEVHVRNNKIYLQTGSDSFAISNDYGKSFISKSFTETFTVWLYTLFADGNNVYVTTDNGLHISNDGGNTFPILRTTADGIGNTYIYDIYASGNNIYLATGAGVSVSTDGGVTFNNVSITGGSTSDIYVSGSTVFASAYNSYNDTGGLSISYDGGLTFTALRTESDGLRHAQVQDIYVQNGGLYLATSGGLSISRDNGVSFENNGLGGAELYDVYANGNTVYAASNNGFSISTDGGYNFVTRTKAAGLGDNYTRTVIEHAGNLYVGTLEGLSVSSDGGASFVNKTSSNGVGTNLLLSQSIRDLSSDGTNLYIATDQGLVMPASKGSTEFTTLTTADGLSSNYITKLHVDNGIVYAGTNNSGLNISIDNGVTWATRTFADGLFSNKILGVFANSNYVYTSGAGSLSSSTDAGVTFIKNTGPELVGAGANSFITGHASYVYLGDWGQFVISDDNGSSFVVRDSSHGLPSSGSLWDSHYEP